MPISRASAHAGGTVPSSPSATSSGDVRGDRQTVTRRLMALPIAVLLSFAVYTMPTLTFKVAAHQAGIVTAQPNDANERAVSDRDRYLVEYPPNPVSLAAISRISAHSAQAASVSITTPTAGDLILVFAHRDGSTTAPSLVSGYTNIANSGANTNSSRVAYKISDGTETTTGTWTNATSIACGVYRGHDINVPIGGFAAGGAASTSMAYNTVTMHIADGSSWVVGFGAHRSATNVTTGPTGMTARSSATDVMIADTGGGVSSWSTQSVTVNANSGWRTYTVEIRQAQTTAPSPDPLVQHIAGAPTEQSGNTFKIRFSNTTLANNCLILCFSHTTGAGVTSVIDNNSTAWTAGPAVTNGNGTTDSRLYYLLNAPATTEVTVVMASARNEFNFCLSEFKGVNASSAVDGTATATTTSTQPVKSGSITTTQAGDLIFQYAQGCQQSFWTNNSPTVGVAPEAGFALLHADLRCMSGAQYGIQAAGGAINPGLDFFIPSNPDSLNTLTIAFKMDGTGTAPSGMRIVRQFTHSPIAATSEKVQFPTSGNLIVVCSSNSSIQINFSAVTDKPGGGATFAEEQLDSTTPQLWWAGNTTPALDRYVTVASSPAGNFVRCFDIAGAHASPLDTSAWASGTQGSAGQDVTNAPQLTPGVASGLTIAILAFGTGPVTTVYGPAGAFTDTTQYVGEDDLGNMNYGDAFGHVFFTSTAQQNWNWHNATPIGSGWIAQATSFKAAATTTAPRVPPIRLIAGRRRHGRMRDAA